MTWTVTELEALRRAYARGIRRVAYDGRVTEYASLDEMLRAIRTIEAELAASSPATARPVAGYAAFSRAR